MFSAQLAEWNQILPRTQATLTDVNELSSFFNEYRDNSGRRMDSIGTVNGQPYTLPEALVAAENAILTLQALRFDKNKPAPVDAWRATANLFNQLEAAEKSLLSTTNGLKLPARELTGITGSTLTYTDDGSTVDLTPAATQLVTAADGILIQCGTFAAAFRAAKGAKGKRQSDAVADDAATSLAKLEEVERAAKESQALLAAIRASSTQATSAANATIAASTAAQANLTNMQETASTAVEQVKATASSSAADAGAIAARVEDATGTKAKIEALNSDITKFSGTLEVSKKQLAENERKTNEIISTLQNREKDVARLADEAEHMLSGSIVAGLATAFYKERDELSGEMSGAFWWFFASILLLTVFSTLMALYIFNIPLHISGINLANPAVKPGQSYVIDLPGVLSRIVLLSGPFWFALFSSRRYKHLFDLKQQYSYKYSMAASMEGFKKQSPSTGDSIAAWVFTIVAQNPVQQKPSRPMDESPLLSIKEFGADIVMETLKRVGVKPTP